MEEDGTPESEVYGEPGEAGEWMVRDRRSSRRPPSFVPLQPAVDAELIRMLWKRLDAIRADPSLTSVERAVREEVELAAYRLALHEIEAHTSADRVRAIREEAELSSGRTERASAVAPVVPSRDPRRREERRRTGTEGV